MSRSALRERSGFRPDMLPARSKRFHLAIELDQRTAIGLGTEECGQNPTEGGCADSDEQRIIVGNFCSLPGKDVQEKRDTK